MVDIIYRNLLRLIDSDAVEEREPIEPMTEWKWRKLYQLSVDYGIGPWVAEGIRSYGDDFFLQPSPALRQQLLDLQGGEKDPECLRRFRLAVDRSTSLLRKFSRESVHTYAHDFIQTIKNIEE